MTALAVAGGGALCRPRCPPASSSSSSGCSGHPRHRRSSPPGPPKNLCLERASSWGCSSTQTPSTVPGPPPVHPWSPQHRPGSPLARTEPSHGAWMLPAGTPPTTCTRSPLCKSLSAQPAPPPPSPAVLGCPSAIPATPWVPQTRAPSPARTLGRQHGQEEEEGHAGDGGARQHFLTCPGQAGSPKLFLDYFFPLKRDVCAVAGRRAGRETPTRATPCHIPPAATAGSGSAF